MHDPMRAAPHSVASDVDAVTSYFPIPEFGMLPVNAFVLKGTESMLVDAGLGLDHEGRDVTKAFMEALRSVIEPQDLKWVWLTHTDLDHTGSLHQALEESPQGSGHHHLPGGREDGAPGSTAARSRSAAEPR